MNRETSTLLADLGASIVSKLVETTVATIADQEKAAAVVVAELRRVLKPDAAATYFDEIEKKRAELRAKRNDDEDDAG